MKIEALSKYIITKPGIPSPRRYSRLSLLSLSRARWLDSQPGYGPWPLLEAPRPPCFSLGGGNGN